MSFNVSAALQAHERNDLMVKVTTTENAVHTFSSGTSPPETDQEYLVLADLSIDWTQASLILKILDLRSWPLKSGAQIQGPCADEALNGHAGFLIKLSLGIENLKFFNIGVSVGKQAHMIAMLSSMDDVIETALE